MCGFCDINKKCNSFSLTSVDSIGKDELFILSSGSLLFISDCIYEYKINFCPMCGEQLRRIGG